MLLATSMVPPGAAQELSTEQMKAELDALRADFASNSPDFWNALRANNHALPLDALEIPILSVDEARAWSRNSVVYETPAQEYAEFITDLYQFYQVHGALGVESLKALTGAEIAEMVDDGLLPSHGTYKKFNLLAFYASLRSEDNVQWLLEQPKTNARAQQRVVEVVEGVTPAMREDAARLLGVAMAMAYADILAQAPDAVEGLAINTHEIPLPPTPPVPGVPGVSELREDVQDVERLAIAQTKHVLDAIAPLVTEVKLTALNELTLVLQELTSLTKIYTTLENYYYEYNYYYHYEFLQHWWWFMDHRVDHIEQIDRVQYRIFTQDTYQLLQYLYDYTDLINVRGLVSGVLGLQYRELLPAEVPAVPGEQVLGELAHPPTEVQLLLDYLMPFTFDITDELSLYFFEEIINHVMNVVRTEFHYYWEYHIRNYWRWDPLNAEDLPFANAALAAAGDYLVSVSEDLEVGKVLNVIPVGTMYREATISILAPATEYPLLDQGVYLQPAPVSSLTNQAAPGSTSRTLADLLHVGPAPNVYDVRASSSRLTDHVLDLATEQTGQMFATTAGLYGVLGNTYGDLTAVYDLIPKEVRVDVPAVAAPQVAVPGNVDTGLDAYQVLAWEAGALPGFVPQFAYAGVRVLDSVDTGRPILVNVDARGLGAPVSFEVDLNQAVIARGQALVRDVSQGELPDTGISEAVPALGPLGGWAGDMAAWGASLAGWATRNL